MDSGKRPAGPFRVLTWNTEAQTPSSGVACVRRQSKGSSSAVCCSFVFSGRGRWNRTNWHGRGAARSGCSRRAGQPADPPASCSCYYVSAGTPLPSKPRCKSLSAPEIKPGTSSVIVRKNLIQVPQISIPLSQNRKVSWYLIRWQKIYLNDK